MRVGACEIFLPVGKAVVIGIEVRIGGVAVTQTVRDFPGARNSVTVVVDEKIQREESFVVCPVDVARKVLFIDDEPLSEIAFDLRTGWQVDRDFHGIAGIQQAVLDRGQRVRTGRELRPELEARRR